MQLLPGFLACLLVFTPAAAQTSPGDPTDGRRIVALRSDAGAHSRTLRRLAALRRAGDRDAFLAELDALRAAQRPRQDELAAVVEAAGARVVERLWLTDALLIEDASGELDGLLEGHPLVERHQRNAPAAFSLAQAIDAQHHDAIGAHAIGLKGSGLHIAVIDSGIDLVMGGTGRPHAAFFPNGNPFNQTGGGIFGSRILSAVDLVLADGVDDAEDVFGHGTNMASVLGGAQFSVLPDLADGVAPDAKLRVWKIGNDNFPATTAGTLVMAQALNQAAADPDIRVANMSTSGSPSLFAAPNAAIDNAVLAGVFVAVAGGNAGSDLSIAHACYNAIVAAGAFEATKAPVSIPGYAISAIGPLPDGRTYPHLMGQGEAVTCAMQDTETVAGSTGGTSSGSAFIAGAALLVTEARPESTPLEVKALLLAESLPSSYTPDPSASGYGYLHVKNAVDAALAGRVVSETIGDGQTKRFQVDLNAGEFRNFALAWNRELTSASIVANLDLEVRDPGGAVVASSASLVDNVEHIRFLAQIAGTYELRVSAASAAGLPVTFALAGASAHSVDDGLGCPGGAPTITGVSATTVPSIAAGPNQVTLSGCNFYGVHTVTLGGIDAVSFDAVDNATLTVHLPKAPALGPFPLEVTNENGSAVQTLNVVAPQPTLILHNSSFFSGQDAEFTLGSVPTDALVLLASLDPAPTIAPGIVDLAIGGGGSSLYPLVTVVMPAPGWQDLSFGFTLAGVPPFTQFYFQAVVVPASPSFPLATTGVQSAPFVF